MKLGFIGTGNIVSDVVTGISKSKINYKQIVISPRNKKKALYLKRRFKKISIARNNQEVVNNSDWIFLGLLPKIGEKILPGLKFKKNQILISFMSTPNYSRLEKLIKKKINYYKSYSNAANQNGKRPSCNFPPE